MIINLGGYEPAAPDGAHCLLPTALDNAARLKYNPVTVITL